MSGLFKITNISRQALHQHLARQLILTTQSDAILSLVKELREDHPAMGCRKMYYALKPESWGRDRFESLLLIAGFRVKYAKNYTRTTESQHKYFFPNLTLGLKLTDINQLWATDITYYSIGESFCYLTFILDVYSRRILGYTASDSLRAEANINALKMAFSIRNQSVFPGLIHHSDRGSQFIDEDYIDLIKRAKITLSMCKEAWENPFAERINGIIKNEYLKHKTIKNLKELKRQLKCAVDSYNYQRPHWSLPDKLSPVNFEKSLLTLADKQRPVYKLYHGENKVERLSNSKNLSPSTSNPVRLSEVDSLHEMVNHI